ncbi:MAG: winged helix-turn-helix domain-containing protein [Bacteroidaceae bacterium]|nr:winged helix-turn-helix domain-containing protein [Bacteroidaceae bacterium]
MLKVKAGETAGMIWNALNGTDGLTTKELKKVLKIRSDKDLFLGLGWLLREDKLIVEEQEADLLVKLA